jgi:PilZ domain
MGRRSEQRIAVSISVVSRGTESGGIPYVVNAETNDISVSGACLHAQAGATAQGDNIEIECRGRTAWFQIRWNGKPVTDGRVLIGVQCLEPSKCIWDVQPKRWQPDTYESRSARLISTGSLPMSPTEPSWPGGKERRQFPRRICAIEAQLTADGYSVGIPVKIADISLGGCYIEMFSPLPRNNLLELSLKLDQSTLHISGKVRSSQTGFGMGIAFTSMSPEDFEKLKKFAPVSANIPQSIKITSVSPAQHVDSHSNPEFHLENSSMTPEALEALVRVLCRKGFLTSAEVLEDIEKSRVQKV